MYFLTQRLPLCFVALVITRKFSSVAGLKKKNTNKQTNHPSQKTVVNIRIFKYSGTEVSLAGHILDKTVDRKLQLNSDVQWALHCRTGISIADRLSGTHVSSITGRLVGHGCLHWQTHPKDVAAQCALPQIPGVIRSFCYNMRKGAASKQSSS